MINLSYCNKLLDCGFSLITVGENKRPNTSWKKYQTEKITKEQFGKNYNIKNSFWIKGDEKIPIQETTKIGICTGFWDVEVIDVDLKILPSIQKQNDFWNEYLSFLKDSIRDFDKKVVIYQTLTGGYHILYRCKKIGGNEKLAKLKEYKEAIIETRGIGGYVVIYEKQVSENAYHNIQEISELDRDTIINCSKYFNYVEENNIPIEQKKNQVIIENEVTPWQDYNEKTNIFDIIGSDFEIIKHLTESTVIRRHGATSDKSGHVFRNSGCMYLFSTGTIYPNEKLLSPYACYTYKYHNGDFSSSAKALYDLGFGTRKIKVPKEIEQEIPKEVLENIQFPIDVFPLKLQNYMLDCNKTLDSNIDYMGASFLWLMSVIIGNSVKIEPKNGWFECCNIWLCCVGKAGVGKTPSIRNIIFPLKKINSLEIKKYIKEREKFEHFQSLDKKAKETAEEIKQPKKTQFIVNDITLEALVEMHEENKNAIGVFKDELAGFFKDMNKYRAGSDLEFWLSSWSNEAVALNRKTAKSSFIESPIIPILGGIQPAILSSIFTEENKDNGFVDRFLLVFPDVKIEKYNTKQMSHEAITWYNDFVIEMYNLVQNHVISYKDDGEIDSSFAKLNNEASIEWERIYNNISDYQNSDDETEYFKSMYPKLKSYVPRFALIFNCLECFETGENYLEITKESFLKAEKLANYFINQAKKIKYDSNDKNQAKKVLKLNENKSKKDQAIEIFKNNTNIKKSEIADMLSISRQLVNKYLKDIEL